MEEKLIDEEHYEREYNLRKDINYRKGEIERLEYINAKHCREIERLNARISTILETTPDISDERLRAKASEDQYPDLFEYVASLIIDLSNEEGNLPVDPEDIDLKYLKSAVRYTMPGLFSMFALLGENDIHKIELADNILHKFGVKTMAKYEELVMRGDIDIATIDRRIPDIN